MFNLLSALTICLPSKILERIEGEKQSPEKRTKLLGYLFLYFLRCASKLTTPYLPDWLGCMS